MVNFYTLAKGACNLVFLLGFVLLFAVWSVLTWPISKVEKMFPPKH